MSIFEMRQYIVKPGTLNKQLDLYFKLGYDVQVKHLGDPVLYTKTEIGNINSYVHIWAYDSLNDRASRRANLENDPRWKEYKKDSALRNYQISQENTILCDILSDFVR